MHPYAKTRGDESGKLPLCKLHHDEYVLSYLAYKESSERAEALYKSLPLLVVSMDAYYEALRATLRCIDALDKEICERDAHCRRFFTQADDGHEKWDNHLRNKRVWTADRARQLCLEIGRVETSLQADSEGSGSDADSYSDSASDGYSESYDTLEWGALTDDENVDSDGDDGDDEDDEDDEDEDSGWVDEDDHASY
ncbi:hypothetical protein TRAPUB_7074 [Trametes pubescens]|uniref:Uncharacterized protein n=1 Tax=Trametes pubescens TaxID=154538 RepID=A0A1M2V483_TRAPU|nr:hypothetical protein TRAPUB_7074 [Trametes pubescens]